MPEITADFIMELPVEISKKLTTALAKAILADRADKGNIQLFDADKNVLLLIVQKGFDQCFIEYFREVKPFDSSACGRAIAIGSPVAINDVMKDVPFTPFREIAEKAGFRAVKSVPILGRNNKRLGVISTHFTHAKSDWNLDSLNEVVKKLAVTLERLVAA